MYAIFVSWLTSTILTFHFVFRPVLSSNLIFYWNQYNPSTSCCIETSTILILHFVFSFEGDKRWVKISQTMEDSSLHIMHISSGLKNLVWSRLYQDWIIHTINCFSLLLARYANLPILRIWKSFGTMDTCLPGAQIMSRWWLHVKSSQRIDGSRQSPL